MTIHLFLAIVCFIIAAICGVIVLCFWATGIITTDEKKYKSFLHKLFNIDESEI